MDHLRRRQQRKACDVCRRRKVRCDIELHAGGSCSVCRKAGVDCRSTTIWAKPRRKSVLTEPAARGPGADAAAAAPDVDSGEKQPPRQRSNAGHPPYDKRRGTQEQLARNGLSRFFRQGISASAWRVFEAADTEFRIAYVGTPASNLAHLVDLHASYRRQPLSPSSVASGGLSGLSGLHGQAGTAGDPGGLGHALHYPYPPIRTPRPWKPNVEDWGFFLAQDLASDVSSFPVAEVRDALVAAYFRDIHPYMPVLPRHEFLAAYRSPDHPPPLLLFQAVLMAGAHACMHPLVARDRHAVKSILFRRAALLYHTRHETDRVHLMIAALLFTWHVGDGDTITGGPWYWSGIAIRIGCGLGGHRHNSALPAYENAQYRRTWWLAFICEVLSALETGRPCAVRAEDIDQAPLSSQDFRAEVAQEADGAEESEETEETEIEKETETASLGCGASASFLNHMVKLCFIGLDILALSAPCQRAVMDVESIDTRLGLWSLQAGIVSSLEDATPAPTGGSLASAAANAMAEQCHLRMYYNLLLLHLHRCYRSTAPITPSSTSICSGAARAIIASLEKLASLGQDRQDRREDKNKTDADSGLARCHFSAVSAVTAAAIQTVNEVREASLARSFLVAMTTLEQLARLLRLTAQLAKHWPNAQAIYDVFQELHQEYETYIAQDLRGEQAMVPDNQPDWNSLLAGVQMAHTTLTNEQGWMNFHMEE